MCVCLGVCVGGGGGRPERRDAPVHTERSIDFEKKQKLKTSRPSARTLHALSVGPTE